LPIKKPAPHETPSPRRKRRPVHEVTSLILEAANEEFRRHGYDNATTATIARNAGTTEAQIFRYYGSKADLFRQSVFNQIDRQFADFNARYLSEGTLPGDFRKLSRLYISELHDFLEKHHELLLSLFVAQTYARHETPGVGEIDALRTYFEHGAAMVDRTAGSRALKIDPQLLVRISFGAVLASVMFKEWLFPPGLAEDASIEEAVIDFVIDGISALSRPSAGV
jgi:AcrR family transcriptional regulator